jgi:hypothetical protein
LELVSSELIALGPKKEVFWKMNNTGRNKKSGYLVALLLVVGLAAFSNSMRELAEIHRFTLDTGRLIAQSFVPAANPQIPEVPQIPQVVIAKLNSCESKQAMPSVEVQGLEDVEATPEPGVEATVPAPPVKAVRVVPRTPVKPTEFQLAKVDRFRKFDFHTAPFEFKIATDDNDDSDASAPSQLSLTMFKAKNRRHNVIKLNPRDKEMILRTLNRSINLRTAS